MPQATSYEVPPWLHGANPLQAIEAGASLGQRIQESNQRAAYEYMAMQQRQAQFQQEAQMKQQQLEQAQAEQQQNFQARQEIHQQNQLQKQQQLAVENAYKQSQLGLAKQKLELTTQAAAKKFQTQQVLQSEINSDTQSLVAEEGMDPDEARQKATVRAYMRHAVDMGLNPAALSQLAKSSSGEEKGFKIVDVKTDRGTYKVMQNPSGAGNILERPEKDLKVPEPRFSVKPPEPTDPQSQATVERISGVTPAQLRGFGVTNVGKYVAPDKGVPATPATSKAPNHSEPAPAPVQKRYRYNPETGKIEELTQADQSPTEEPDASVAA